MQHELLVTLVLLQNLLVDFVVLPVLESLGLGLGKTGTHGKTGLGQIHRLLVLVCHGTPFMSWARTPSGHQKKRPSLQAGTKRHKTGCAPAKALRLTTQLRCPRPLLARSHPLLGWPVSTTISAISTKTCLCGTSVGTAAPG